MKCQRCKEKDAAEVLRCECCGEGPGPVCALCAVVLMGTGWTVLGATPKAQ